MRLIKWGTYEDPLATWDYFANEVSVENFHRISQLLMKYLPNNYEISQINVDSHMYYLNETRSEFVPVQIPPTDESSFKARPTEMLGKINTILGKYGAKKVGLTCNMHINERQYIHAVQYSISSYRNHCRFSVYLHTDLFHFRDVSLAEYEKFNKIIHNLRDGGVIKECEFLASDIEVRLLGDIHLWGLTIPIRQNREPAIGIKEAQLSAHNLRTVNFHDIPLPEGECRALTLLETAFEKPILSLSPIYGDGIGFRVQDGHVTELILRFPKLDTLPDVFDSFPSLRRLSLFCNRLQVFPSSITRLRSIQELQLTGNAFKEIPLDINKLSALRYLFLSENQLNSIPTSLGKLTNLRFLYLNANQLSELPDGFENLEKLVFADVSQNHLTKLPGNLENLYCLEYINLEANYLTEIPLSLSTLPALKSLNISKNNITTLPEAFQNSKLQQIEWDRNPFEKPSQDLAEKINKNPWGFPFSIQ